jgi:hypothetical protein
MRKRILETEVTRAIVVIAGMTRAIVVIAGMTRAIVVIAGMTRAIVVIAGMTRATLVWKPILKIIVVEVVLQTAEIMHHNMVA